jgi:hypothetical protein
VLTTPPPSVKINYLTSPSSVHTQTTSTTMPVSTRKSSKIMNMNTHFDAFVPASSKSTFGSSSPSLLFLYRTLVLTLSPITADEASAADLTAFLDLSSFGVSSSAAADSIAVPDFSSFTHAFDVPTPPSPKNIATGALRPVDDSLLDSPLGLELTPSSLASSASSFSGSPYDNAYSMDYTSPLMGSAYGSPALVDSFGGASLVGDLPSLFASVSSAAMQALPAWNPQDVAAQFQQLPQQQHEPTPVMTSRSPSMEDIKPIISPDLVSTMGLFDFSMPPPPLGPAPAAPVEAVMAAALNLTLPEAEDVLSSSSAAASAAAAKRKSVAQLKKEAAALVEEKAFKKDNFKGFRNTKKPMIQYDAPTLPKNYLTESATSRKRKAAEASSPAPSSSKRGRSASVAPPVELPQTAAEPLDADDLDESQLSAIELKRRQNTLAARRSRMRKAEFVKSLQDEIDRLKQLNEQLQQENARLKAGSH